MEYSASPQTVVHVGTGKRMHEDNQPLPSIVSDSDMNMLIWSLMHVLDEAGISGAAFNPSDPATYDRFLVALKSLFMSNAINGWLDDENGFDRFYFEVVSNAMSGTSYKGGGNNPHQWWDAAGTLLMRLSSAGYLTLPAAIMSAADNSKAVATTEWVKSVLGAGLKVVDLSAASSAVLLDRFDEVHVITRSGLNSMIWTQMVVGGIYEMSIKAYGYGAQNADWRLRPNGTSYATQFFSSNVAMTGTTTASAVATRSSSEASFFVDPYSGTTGENLVATVKLYPETASWKYLHAQSADSNGVAMTSSVWVNTSTPWTTVGELQLWSGAAGGQGSVPNPSLVNSTVRIRRLA